MITLDRLNAYIAARNSTTDTQLAQGDGFYYFTEGEGEVFLPSLNQMTYRQWTDTIDQFIDTDF